MSESPPAAPANAVRAAHPEPTLDFGQGVHFVSAIPDEVELLRRELGLRDGVAIGLRDELSRSLDALSAAHQAVIHHARRIKVLEQEVTRLRKELGR